MSGMYQRSMIKPFRGATLDRSNLFASGLTTAFLFNEGTGNKVYGLSGNGEFGSFVNMDVTAWVGGNNGYVLSFDGNNDYIRVPYSNLFAFGATSSYSYAFSLSTLNTPIGSSDSVLENFDGAGPYSIASRITTAGKLSCAIFDGTLSSVINSDADITDGIWRNYVFTRDVSEDKIKLYVDGILDDEIEDTTTGSLDDGDDLLIGARENVGPGNFGNFEMGYLYIWNKVLSPIAVARLHTNTYQLCAQRTTPQISVSKRTAGSGSISIDEFST